MRISLIFMRFFVTSHYQDFELRKGFELNWLRISKCVNIRYIIILKTTLSCKFEDCLLMNAEYDINTEEITIDEDSIKFLIEYHLEQCAKDGFIFLNIFSKKRFWKFLWISKFEPRAKNISDNWKFTDEYYLRVAEEILIPCDGENTWFVQDWFLSSFSLFRTPP